MLTQPKPAGITLAAVGWCHCRERHTDTYVCPGPLQADEAGRAQFCTHCGSKYRKKASVCETRICNRCHGKCL